jgi:thiosulfate reductase cytochrome b subunit
LPESIHTCIDRLDQLVQRDEIFYVVRSTLEIENPEETSAGTPRVTLRLERKHPLAIRWMHWINFPLLFIMILSGIRIYWNDSDNAHLHTHAIYRIGYGSHTLVRMFPEPVANALHIPWQVTQGMGDHFFFMWLFALNGIAYMVYSLISGEWRFLLPCRGSVREALRVILVSLRLRRGLPSKTKYNGAQRIAYSAVIVMGAGGVITGLAIYKPTQLHYLTTMLGGYEWARWEHFWLTMGFCLFFLVHVVQVAFAGWNNFRSMISGFEIRPANEPSLERERRGWR